MDDLLLGPIVGGLSSSQAYLWGRASGPGVLHAWLGSRPDLSDAYLAAESLPLTAENGFAGVAPLTDLKPNTHYRYALTLSARPPSPEQAPFPRFTSFPPDGQSVPFAFAFGSCFRPADDNGGRIFRAIDRQRQQDNLRFILLIGDQIYADAYEYNGLAKIACDLQEYRDVYTYTWSRPAMRRLLANLPAFMTLDDHEVDDDWRWLDEERRWAYIPWWDQIERWMKGRPPQERLIPRKRVQEALQAYWEHQGMHAPHFELPPSLDQSGQYVLAASDPGSLAYSFTYGCAAFFVLDTRTMRVRGRAMRTMLGEAQWQAFEAWLKAVSNAYPVKFLVSSCALLFQMWLDIARDRWSGFPEERNRLLELLGNHISDGIYVLTGDMHAAYAVSAELCSSQGHSVPIWEFCSSPFEQDPNRLCRRTYYPIRSGLVKNQKLHFTHAQNNFGVVQVDFPAGVRSRVRFHLYNDVGAMLAEVESLNG